MRPTFSTDSVTAKNERQLIPLSQSREKQNKILSRAANSGHKSQREGPGFYVLVPKPLLTLRDHVTILVYRRTYISDGNLV